MNAHEKTLSASTERDGNRDLGELLGEIGRFNDIFDSWEPAQGASAHAYGEAIETLHAEALRRLIRALKTSPEAIAALKQAASDELVYAVLRRHNIVKPSLNERVDAALDSVRPMLASHGGDVELVRIAPPNLELRFVGACDSCPASVVTFYAGVKKAIEAECPELTEIIQVKGFSRDAPENKVRFVSPFALGEGGRWVLAARLADLVEERLTALTLGEENILLWRSGGAVSCFANACAHLGMAIDGGAIDEGILTCPWHGFQYDLASGECLTAPEVQLQPFAVRVIGARVEVRLPT